MLRVSPRDSHYAVQTTPYQSLVLQTGGHELANWEKGIELGRVTSYFLGSVLFLVGSIYFYPEFAVMWNGKAGLFASWCFVIGCIMFFVGANLDYVQVIRYDHGSQLRQVLRAYSALGNYMASCIFILGALYFLPTWYLKAPELGSWSFIVGCILFCITAVVELLFVCMTHEDMRMTGFKLKNVWCYTAVMAVATFLGALFFILGSWYYLPRYINRIDDGVHYMNRAITFYVIGSVCFVISALALIPDVYRTLRVHTAPHDAENKV
ncbi:unnamed protein product [Hyaloperonospora brassicae]|uniref:YrhK domain-containing protein n=1 Tax=Hyaloperonospora brassicae TaxID=162125 RepID=A0AAV0U3X9_HYABA|nr:unnamed protein product [Hyaloperonospora brassicae]